MERKKRYLYKQKLFLYKTHERWMNGKAPRNRTMGTEEYQANFEKWVTQQCFDCQFYIPVAGEMGMDWGVCSHPDSPFDAKLMFGHDGCDHHSPAAEEES